MSVTSIRYSTVSIIIVLIITSLLGFSTQAEASDPLAVSLRIFTATGSAEGIVLEWATETEDGTAAFLLKRASSRNGFTPLVDNDWADDQIQFYEAGGSGELVWSIAGRGSVASGATYTVIDPDVEVGVTYWYQLVEQETSGNVHGASDLFDEYTKSAIAGHTPTPPPDGGDGSGVGLSTPIPTPTATESKEETNTPTPLPTATSTPTTTPTNTPSPEPTTPGNTTTITPSATPTHTPTSTPTNLPTTTTTTEATSTLVASDSPEDNTATPQPTETSTPTPTPTATPTETPTPSESNNEPIPPTSTSIAVPTATESTIAQPTSIPTSEPNQIRPTQQPIPTITPVTQEFSIEPTPPDENDNTQELGVPAPYPSPEDDGRTGDEPNEPPQTQEVDTTTTELNPAPAQVEQESTNQNGEEIAVVPPSNEQGTAGVQNNPITIEPNLAPESLGQGIEPSNIGTLLTEAESNDRSIGTLGGNSGGQLAPPPIIQDQSGAINNMVLWLAFIGSLLVFGAGVMAAILIFSRRRSDK